MSASNHGNSGRFRKGISGNPSGRPRKRMIGSTDNSVLTREISIKFGGENIKVKPQKAVVLSLLHRGLKGDTSAMQMFLNNSDALRETLPSILKPKIILQTSIRPRTTDDVLQTLGLFEEVNGACCLPLWLVKEGVKRNPGLNLAGIDRSSLLAPLEDKAAAEKLLRPHGLGRPPP